jgi:hypothetical protein
VHLAGWTWRRPPVGTIRAVISDKWIMLSFLEGNKRGSVWKWWTKMTTVGSVRLWLELIQHKNLSGNRSFCLTITLSFVYLISHRTHYPAIKQLTADVHITLHTNERVNLPISNLNENVHTPFFWGREKVHTHACPCMNRRQFVILKLSVKQINLSDWASVSLVSLHGGRARLVKKVLLTSLIYRRSLISVPHQQNRVSEAPQLSNPFIFFVPWLFWRWFSHDLTATRYMRSLNYQIYLF